MLSIGRAGVHIAGDFAGNLRPVFADAAAVKQHAFGNEAGFADELLVELDHGAIRDAGLHELHQFVKHFDAGIEGAL